MAIVGTAEIEILPNTARFASKTEAETTPAAEGIGRKLGGILGAALAVGGAYKFAKDSVEAFNEVQQATLKLDSALEKNKNTIGVSSAAFEGLNKHILNTTKFDDEAAKSVEAQLAQYNLTAKQIRELTPLVADYAARTGKDVVDAAKLAGGALLGKGRALKDVGIAFKDLKDPTKNYTELVDGLREKVGGFAEKEGKTFAGRIEILKNQFKEFEESVGQRLVPILTVLLSLFVTRLIPGLSRVAETVGQLVGPTIRTLYLGVRALFLAFQEGDVTSDGFVGVMERIGVALRAVVQHVKDFISGFTQGTDAIGSAQTKWAQWGAVAYEWVLRIEGFIRSNLHPVLAALGAVVLAVVVPAFVSWAAGAIAAAVATVAAAAPVVLLVAAVAALGFGIVWAYEHFKIFRDVVNAIADYFTTSFIPQMRAVGQFVVDVWNEIFAVGKAVFDAIGIVIRFFVDGPIKFLSDQIGTFAAWWSAHWDEMRAVFVFIFEAIRLYVTTWWTAMVGLFHIAMDVILPLVQVAWQELQAVFHVTFDVITGIARVAWDYISGVFATARDVILGIVGVLLDLLTGKWGRAWADIKATVSNVLGDISGTIGKVLGDIVSTIGNLADDVFTAAVGIGHAIISGITHGIAALVGDIGEAIKNVIGSAIGHLPGPIKDAVRGVIGAFGDGGMVPGPVGQAQLAVVHGGEFVLSNDMLRGLRSVPSGAGRAAAASREVQVNVEISMPGLATAPEARRMIEDVARGEFSSAMTRVLAGAGAGAGSREV